MLCVGCRDVFLFFFVFVFLLSLRVIISTYEPLYNYRNFNFLLLLWTEKIFMAMNKQWQLFSYFSLWFLFPVNILWHIFATLRAFRSAKLKIGLYIFTNYNNKKKKQEKNKQKKHRWLFFCKTFISYVNKSRAVMTKYSIFFNKDFKIKCCVSENGVLVYIIVLFDLIISEKA